MEEEQSQNQAVESKRDAYLKKLREKYPGDNFDDDEAIFGRVAEDEAARDEQVSKYETESGKLLDMYTRDPRSAAFFENWRNNGDPLVFLIRELGDDFKAALDDPERAEEISKAHSDWLAKVAKEKELQEQAADNLNATLQTLEEFQKENDLTDEEASKIFDFVYKIIGDGIMNVITKDTFAIAAKALNYEKDVESALAEGEIKGRNAKIDDKLQKKAVPTDIPPSLSSNATEPPKEKQKRRNMFLAGQ